MTPDAAELHRRARRMLPRGVYDYYAGGSGRERTLRANEKAWRQVWLAPRVLREVSSVDTSTRLLGTEFATPLCVAPTGYQRLAHPDGELATAAGAARAGALNAAVHPQHLPDRGRRRRGRGARRHPR